ncbi:2-oxoglutarate dehydrogenase E2, partial [Candidatus Aerophobetes bacterium]|nr:2-oxoglutarate dehydrogenase E2 [Candidatus Aerophobetes bacterium]
EPLLEVMTDKATYEMESPAEGILTRILVAEDEISPVESVLGIIEKK